MSEKELNKAIKQYLKEIRQLMLCDIQTKNRFLKGFKDELFGYIEENNVDNFNEVRAHFGEPVDITRAFLENADIKTIKKKMTISKIAICGVIAIILIWAIGVTCDVVDSMKSNHGYGKSEYVDEIPEEAVLGDEIL